ncbi:bifunctional metallophosphatase/5'-nucleotidase [Treponema phagedenis]|uniref:5'-nucleotidase, C-terminal domain protein (Modular protein) n=1 Tax=Treponema phagedenis TaxID=162 RepID=A0A0B7GW18_TREPH|nr:5'-nucleotidase C-terminal domain-containing protein [Treponema phagedenis]QEJ93999.1 bifunctional metallophosphatase/5'-nucleotidase [Treponema phagedenis]QEJ97018.1 bifunctional metallophosphatase/5'-nucleotidase [Treponema phagedenis]QEK01994.1 bifunctional metallophosphatase/5'-nucleotidase [Treponema phagedenis]QEK02928.1 bifunctional metallophosphatase/5'-nucleotidase [Treponema phagedenis]QEK07108.1 bifunctional metallophosphatase/5'-nucleotidase [Treponema phagedenis]
MNHRKKLPFFAALLSAILFIACLGSNAGIQPDGRTARAKGKQFDTVQLEHKLITKGEAGADEVRLVFGATADVHGRLYPYDYAITEEDPDAGYSKTYTIVKEMRAKYPNMVLMDVGDTVQDNSAELFNDLETHPMIQAMNYMDYDIWVLGNHEFNFEKEFLVRNIKNFKGAVVTANIYNTADNSSFVLPYQLLNIEGVRVAVVGLVPPHIPMWEASSPSHFKGLSFEEPLTAVRKTVDSLKGQYDVLVGAFHLGRSPEYGSQGSAFSIAEAIPEFDLIFGGHEHARYVTEVAGKNGDKTWVLEPGCYGWALAVGEITVKKQNDTWKVVSVKAENKETEKIESDSELEKEFRFVHDESLADANTVIGNVTEDFIKRVDYITGKEEVTTMPTIQLEDTALIDFINEVQLKVAKADVASVAAFRADINLKKGSFKKKDVAFIYKYNNTLMGVNMSGENLLKYMEWSARYYNTTKEGDVTISFDPNIRAYNYDMFDGITYNIDISKPAGSRIVDAKINGAPIDPKKIYKVAVNNYRFGTLQKLGLATPEDVYFDSYETMQDAGRIRDLIVQHVKQKKNISPKVNNNWKLIGFNDRVEGREAVLEKIRKGEITIPRSKDGRTPNVKSINIKDIH